MNPERKFDLSAWWQILRAGNIFTAVSNVIAGFLLVHGQWQPFLPLLLAMLASATLYEAGMVLNDVYDSDLDAVERPERPIPSGRIDRKTAKRVGIALLVTGIVAAHVASALTTSWQTVQVSLALATTIAVYNLGLKSSIFGPLAMGSCRLLNVLLGASVDANLLTSSAAPALWLLAAGVGIYTVGITYIARHEVANTSRIEIMIGSLCTIGGPLLIGLLPLLKTELSVPAGAWLAIWSAILVAVGRFAYKLQVSTPEPWFVRLTVGRLIGMFIVIDAAVAALAAGWIAGAIVLSLIIPTRLLARRIAMT